MSVKRALGQLALVRCLNSSPATESQRGKMTTGLVSFTVPHGAPCVWRKG
jgi:hypothetical protein